MASALKNTAAFEACEKLYLNEEFADVHFVFNVDDESEKAPANKANLAVLSPVFRKMFFGSLPGKGDVEIVDADDKAFKEFHQFFYLDEVSLTMENIETVVRLTDKYDVLEYVNAFAVFLKRQLTLDNRFWLTGQALWRGAVNNVTPFIHTLAVNLKNDELIEFCEGKIINSPKGVFAAEAFKRCNKSILKRILELDLVCTEADVFDACLTWTKYACEQNDLDATEAVNLRTQLGDCLKLIRFGAMASDEFYKRYMSFKVLFTREEFEDIIFSLS
ncbi:BTB/POZ domain-containing protein 2-like, partial [Sitodiplosis mosellana]|uniref:BTB/POZ domain-containing protein 2-like n=1 Tax=Sitodiplosis mosellana TaxID=263140 RepID=UPI002444B469